MSQENVNEGQLTPGMVVSFPVHNVFTLTGMSGYETYFIDNHTIGVRPKWISVKEQIPAEWEKVLATDGIQIWIDYVVMFSTTDYIWGSVMHNDQDRVKFWMPLPPPGESL